MRTEAPYTREYTRRDWRVAIALVLVILLLGLGQLTRGIPGWGDDHSAYISEGIAIANGELAEQAGRNYTLHPSPLPAEADSSGLVYVWGYPLLLSLVYRLVGFDMQSYSTILYYKFPSLICLSLLAGVLYLFLRRRASGKTSALLTLAFCLFGEFFVTLNDLYCDICFLFFSTLSLLLLDAFLGAVESARKSSIPFGVALGVVLWYTCETRLNGSALVLTVLIAQLFFLSGSRERRKRSRIALHILPYIVCFALRAVSERLWLMPATPNLSDMDNPSLSLILKNLAEYRHLILYFLYNLTGFRLHIGGLRIGRLLWIPCVVGLISRGFRRENLHLLLLFGGTCLVSSMLPYLQGLRYIYFILPILMIYLGCGVERILTWLTSRLGPRPRKLLPGALGILFLACVLSRSAIAVYLNVAADGRPLDTDVYSPAAVETYRYIQENIPEDATIASWKPRAVFLNTNRMGFRPGENGHDIADAGYFLIYDEAQNDLIPDDIRDHFQVEYTADNFTLYRIADD